MRHKSATKTGMAMVGLCCAVVLSGCQKGADPVVPAGQAGYDAIALPPSAADVQRYALQPGDILSVRVYDEPELSVEDIVVDNAGVVSLPLIGDVTARGLTATELANTVEAAYAAEYVRDPRVTVFVKKAQARTIAVEGEVALPGVYPFVEGQTLLTALALARSPTEKAKLDEVMIFRTAGNQRLAGRFDASAIRGGRMPDVALMPGDTVVVGFSSTRGAFLDAVRALPVLGIFRPF
ncbi:polysaccharide export protein [Qipengyuania sp. XHP0207]|uniref:polysaccharide biosynthesis/export family protein n=1 Tax=Qipengyuania sp. XHP0207 TaxID=3038078 RepID=UPI00241D293D|nr:polysaccharide biosynthesis/export family protein [Qipengyuania sp. XHP0207]MDG5746956.1 polysaccharide export protein [Qipengyuania sp. XHP0207]